MREGLVIGSAVLFMILLAALLGHALGDTVAAILS